ncbi:PREDICTED: uncharacterized protein LOC103916679 [Pygoscelis adeliae]|uniref:uncharacterized protein LOC103916679 n=1 Tax=Pygoscelis adeliae TaxID=9238 RepID=UPI0004F50688|nr:PREDICTED: uncharacterized protein LOC103916679 [Pygoscelis adeliae]
MSLIIILLLRKAAASLGTEDDVLARAAPMPSVGAMLQRTSCRAGQLGPRCQAQPAPVPSANLRWAGRKRDGTVKLSPRSQGDNSTTCKCITMLTSTLALAQKPRWTCQTSRVHRVVRASKRWKYFWDELGFPLRSQTAQAVSLFKMTLKLQSTTLAHSDPDGCSLSSSSSVLPRLKVVNYREIKSPVKKSLCLKHSRSLPRSR